MPPSTHISRLVAARFQLDLLQHTMLLIARTDAESARLLSSTIDARDHAHIRGVRTRLPDGSHRLALAEVLDRAEAEGRSGAEIDNLEAKWLSEVKLTTFDEGETSHLGRGRSPHTDAIWLPSGRAGDSGVKRRSLAAQGVCSRALSGGCCRKVEH